MEPVSDPNSIPGTPRMLGRYELIGRLAAGGMATVYLARHTGQAGFERLFAVKMMHPHLAENENFVKMLLDEARIAARLHHPNVVPIVDLGSQDGVHYVVMEYIEGCSLASLLRRNKKERPPRLIVRIMLDVLAGLHAAHSLMDDDGTPMNLVHRDVSPQNVMIGIDGTTRLTDFGIARARTRLLESTRPGELKGKIAYMSPEHVLMSDLDHRADLFSAGAMFWSALTARRLFRGKNDAETFGNIVQLDIPPPSTIGLEPPDELDVVAELALQRDPEERFQTALAMEEALREAAGTISCVASKREVAAWVKAGFGEDLAERRRLIKEARTSSQLTTDLRISMPSLGASSPGLTTPSDVRETPTSTRRVDLSDDAPDITLPTALSPSSSVLAAEEQSRRPILFAVGTVGVVVVALGGTLHTCEQETTSAVTPAPIASSTIVAPTLTPSLTPSHAEPLPAVAKSSAEAEETGSAKTAKSAAVPRPVAPARRRARVAPPAAAPPPAPVAPPPPVQPAAPKSPQPWDRDSPLPPP